MKPFISPVSTVKGLTESKNDLIAAARSLNAVSVKWEKITNIFIVTKPDLSLIPKTRYAVQFLLKKGEELGGLFHVTIEDIVFNHPAFDHPATLHHKDLVKVWNAKQLHEKKDSPFFPELDFIITLGGDGTVLYTSWLFQRNVPPVLAFHLGSLGFLTVFDFNCFDSVLAKLLSRKELKSGEAPGLRLSLRARLHCSVYRKVTLRKSFSLAANKLETSNSYSSSEGTTENEILFFTGFDCGNVCFPDESFEILNDLVVDRGPSGFISHLEVYGDNRVNLILFNLAFNYS